MNAQQQGWCHAGNHPTSDPDGGCTYCVPPAPSSSSGITDVSGDIRRLALEIGSGAATRDGLGELDSIICDAINEIVDAGQTVGLADLRKAGQLVAALQHINRPVMR